MEVNQHVENVCQMLTRHALNCIDASNHVVNMATIHALTVKPPPEACSVADGDEDRPAADSDVGSH